MVFGFKIRNYYFSNSILKYKIKDSKIYFKSLKGIHREPDWKLFIPPQFRKKVLVECHDDPLVGHFKLYVKPNSVLFRIVTTRHLLPMFTNNVRKCETRLHSKRTTLELKSSMKKISK